VNETGISRPQGPYRDLIRSKARRNWTFDSEKDHAKGKKAANSQLAQSSLQRRTRGAITCPIINNVKGPQDPFNTLPIGSNSRTQELLSHCEYIQTEEMKPLMDPPLPAYLLATASGF
jgi:hypothetical protein